MTTPTDPTPTLVERVEQMPAEYHKGGRLVIYRSDMLDIARKADAERQRLTEERDMAQVKADSARLKGREG